MNKYEFVRGLIVGWAVNGDRLLDIGCREAALKSYLGDGIRYTGIDIAADPEVRVDVVGDVEEGLPFRNGSFEHVVVLDVLEHVDTWDSALDEILRVSSRQVVIMVPNLGHLLFRLRFLVRGRLTGKYDLWYDGPRDRHRWVPVLPQTDAYFAAYVADRELELEVHRFAEGRYLRPFRLLARTLRVPPVWWVWSGCYLLRRPTLDPR